MEVASRWVWNASPPLHFAIVRVPRTLGGKSLAPPTTACNIITEWFWHVKPLKLFICTEFGLQNHYTHTSSFDTPNAHTFRFVWWQQWKRWQHLRTWSTTATSQHLYAVQWRGTKEPLWTSTWHQAFLLWGRWNMISHNHHFGMRWLSTMLQDITTSFDDGNNIGNN